MRTAILSLFGLLLADGARAQQCALDTDGYRRTAINELVLAVGQALNGCPGGPVRTPTPQADGCPFQFNDHNSDPGDQFCIYEGDTDAECIGEFSAASSWSTQGTSVISVIADSTGAIAVVGVRTSPTRATVDYVSNGPDFEEEINATGTLRLPDNSSFAFDFDVPGDCAALEFDGDFDRLGRFDSSARRIGLGALIQRPDDSGTATVSPDARAMMKRLLERLGSPP